ncbi:hypothetical protein LCGC14_0557050, partial [marine sediment metagenome]
MIPQYHLQFEVNCYTTAIPAKAGIQLSSAVLSLLHQPDPMDS